MSEKTHIWFLIGTLERGGAEKTLVDLANNLPQSEYDITVWTIKDEGTYRKEVADHVAYQSIGAKSKLDVPAVVQFIRAVQRQQPDILQSFLFFDNVLARLAGISSKSTTVITGVRSVPNRRSPLRTALDRLTLPLSDHIISNSNAGKKWIVEQGADPDTVSVVYNGRNLERYASAEASPELYDELKVADGPVIGTVGRLLKRKGHYDLLDAWPAVLESYPNATLLLVGDGPERKGLIERSKSLRCASSIRFLGMREDVPELLDVMDVFVFPSHFEGLPGALLEAMAAKVPIICTPVDGNSELVIENQSGMYVEPQSPNQIAMATLSLLNDLDKRQQLATNAQRRAKIDFSLQSMTKAYSQLYELFI